MVGRIDIHRFDRRLAELKAFLRRGAVSSRSRSSVPITRRNVDFILSYDEVRFLEGVKVATRWSDMNRLIIAARFFGKDFDKVSKRDVKSYALFVSEHYALWTQSKLRMTFKRFFKWLRVGDDYLSSEGFPDEVRFLRRGIKKRDTPKVRGSDCWSEKEIAQLIAAATAPRDRAIASLITESGARVGELGGLHVGDVYQDQFGFLLHLSGKTGQREPRVIYSGPSLAAWLNVHPKRDDPNAPLFTKSSSIEPLSYSGIKCILRRLARRAGLSHKKCNPHIFRHSRATLLAKQFWPEPVIKQYLGWDKDSKMMSTYSHISSYQANAYLLKAHGIKDKDSSKPTLVAKLCATCHMENGPDSKFCSRCGRPLGHKEVLEYNQKQKTYSDDADYLFSHKEFRELAQRLLKERKDKGAIAAQSRA